MLSEEGGRFRPPPGKFEPTLKVIIDCSSSVTIMTLLNNFPISQ
jgi:hypothetical protein